MVNVCSRRCAHDSCAKRASYRGEGSKIPVYCQQHAEHGMVDVRTRPHLNGSRTTKPAQDVPTNVATTAPTRHAYYSLGGSELTSDASSKVTHCQKRPRLELDVKHAPPFLIDTSLKEEIPESTTTGPSTRFPHTPSSHSSCRHLADDAVGTASTQTNQFIPGNLGPLPNGHPSAESIKHEIGVGVFV